MALPSQCADGQQVTAVTPAAWSGWWVSMVGWEEFLALSWQHVKADDYATTVLDARSKPPASSTP
jgi:hypothetical protein